MAESLVEFVEEYKRLGWVLVPLKAGEKKPLREGWGKRENCVSPSQEWPQEAGGVGLAHAYSGTCSIDLDDLSKATSWFLARGVHIGKYLNADEAVRIVSGAPNKAKLLYRLPPGTEPLPHVKRDRDGFELRCATRKGLTVQDVLPPSIHPGEKKPYKWMGDFRALPMLPHDIAEIWYEFLRANSERQPERNAELLDSFIRSAIKALDPGMEYNDWLAVGMALHSVSPEYLDLWDEWSAGDRKYSGGDCESRWLGFEPGGGITLGTFFKMAKDEGWNATEGVMEFIGSYNGDTESLIQDVARLKVQMGLTAVAMDAAAKKIKEERGASLSAIREVLKESEKEEREDERLDLDHGEIAEEYWKQTPPGTVNCGGTLWMYREDHYKVFDHDNLMVDIAKKFSEQKACKTRPHYSQIAAQVISMNRQDGFFDRTAEGVATVEGYYRIDGDRLVKEFNTPEHRKRWLIPVTPRKGEMPLFRGMIRNALGHDPSQIDALQRAMGAILFNKLVGMQRAILLYGASGTGKSVLLKIIGELFPRENRTFISPEEFRSEYNIADLAKSAINLVAELPEMKAINSKALKSLIAGDPVRGRPIYGKPIDFVANTSHVFASNYLPTTEEVDNAFFRRFLIFEFRHPPEQADDHLFEKIRDQELGAIVYWALMGAVKIAREEKRLTSKSHEKLIVQWMHGANVALEFLHDDEWVILNAGESKHVRGSALYGRFKLWCAAQGRTQISYKKFCERVLEFQKLPKMKVLDGYKGFRGIDIAFDPPSE